MKSVTTTEAKRRLGRLIDEAAAGAVIEITRRGRPVIFLGTATIKLRQSNPDELRRAAERVKRMMNRRPKSLANAARTLESIRYRSMNG